MDSTKISMRTFRLQILRFRQKLKIILIIIIKLIKMVQKLGMLIHFSSGFWGLTILLFDSCKINCEGSNYFFIWRSN